MERNNLYFRLYTSTLSSMIYPTFDHETTMYIDYTSCGFLGIVDDLPERVQFILQTGLK